MRKPPSLRHNNGSNQIRVCVDGADRRIHRLGSWSDPNAVARVQALSARIWSDWCSGCLALYTYQAMPSKEYPQPLARGAGVELLPALIASEVEEIQLSVA